MVVVFDLDDTLYEEKHFVYSGFKQVANWISNMSNKKSREILRYMLDDLNINGRGQVFDNTLERYYQKTKKNIRKCLSIYRLHIPNINLTKDVVELLLELKKNHQLYILTDGNKIVQKNKIKSLGVEKYIIKAFITHRYGISSSKPSLKCFKLIKNITNVNWGQIVYIGDNPHKDFVNLNKVQAITIRVLKGSFAKDIVRKDYDAIFKINKVTEVTKVIKIIYENRKLSN